MKFRGTGECFEDCTLKFSEMIRDRRHRMNPSFFLVHGILRRKDGTRFSHAWLELDGKVIESAYAEDGEKMALVEPAEDFYKRVERSTRYTWENVLRVAAAHGDIPPPWDPEYRALCSVIHPVKPKDPQTIRAQWEVIEKAIAERKRQDRRPSWWDRFR